MDLLDTRTNIELVLEHERNWMDILRTACVTPKGKDPVFAAEAVWLIEHGYIPQIEDHHYWKLHCLINLVFKLTSELLYMGRYPSRDGGPWDKLIRVQRYVTAKESIELVLEASK